MTRLLAVLAALALTSAASLAEDRPAAPQALRIAVGPATPAHVEGDEGWDGSQTVGETETGRPPAASKLAEDAPKPTPVEAPKPTPAEAAPKAAETTAPSSPKAEEKRPESATAAAPAADAPKPAPREAAKAAPREAAAEAKPAARPDAKPEARPDARPAADTKKSDAKPIARPVAAPLLERPRKAREATAAESARPMEADRSRARTARTTVETTGAEPRRVRSSERQAARASTRSAADDAEPFDVAQRTVRDPGPITGGILCGGGSKWRCNMIEREHDKFYKFTPGHNWTDQTMATDFCATNKQMRVASATRIKSVTAGCCGFTVVQVTCRR